MAEEDVGNAAGVSVPEKKERAKKAATPKKAAVAEGKVEEAAAPVQKEKPQEAEVIAVGPGTKDVTMQVKAGQKVVYSKYAGTNVKLDDENQINCY